MLVGDGTLASWLLMLAALLAGACGAGPGAGRRELERERAAWDSLGWHSYTFTYQFSCFCPGSGDVYRVVVRDGRAVEVALADRVAAVWHAQGNAANFQTVDSILAMLAKAYEKGADRVDVWYDPLAHYPRRVFIDWRRRSIDDEISFEAGFLLPTQPP